jgi:hypothetical protein
VFTESAPWPLAAGSLCAFVLAVLLDHVPWAIAFVLIAGVVAAWSFAAPILVGVALGVVAWMCVTGFDVNAFGTLRVAGWGDAARAVVLVGIGAGSAGIGRLAAKYHVARPDEPGMLGSRARRAAAVRARDRAALAGAVPRPAESPERRAFGGTSGSQPRLRCVHDEERSNG